MGCHSVVMTINKYSWAGRAEASRPRVCDISRAEVFPVDVRSQGPVLDYVLTRTIALLSGYTIIA